MASILSKKKKKNREKYRLSDLKTLGLELLSSRAKINNLPLLLTFVSPTSRPQYALEALLFLQAFFTPLLPLLPLSSYSTNTTGTAKDDPDFIYRIWLRSKFDEFLNSLIDISVSPQSEEALREVVLDTIMEFVKVGNGGRFHSAIYHRFIQSIVHSTLGIDVLLDLLASKYFKYIDIRYFTYIAVEKLARTLEAKDISDNKIVSSDGDTSHSRPSVELSIRKIYYILSHIPSLENMDEKADYEMWNGLGVFIKDGDCKEHSELQKAEDKLHKIDKSSNNVLSAANIAKKIKIKFTKAWASFLRLPLPLDVYKEVLVTLHEAVIPHFSNPILLCDFLTRSYNIGGIISVMALSSLYILMTQHGLEYPNFYEKLYALLVPSIFMVKHRAKFFELLDSCLKSPLLPAYLAAAFTKKLSRLSLSVPPSGGLVIIALIHNLLRRHPSINWLVHREDGGEISEKHSREGKDGESENSCVTTELSSKERGIDHFDNEEISPVKTNAVRSSLWEVDTVRHHYCPPVSRFVLSLENDLTVRRKTTELAVNDFSSGSYVTIFREEIRRRVKQVPLAFYKATPTSLFSESDFPGWTFKFKENDESVTSNDDNGNIDKSEDQDHGFAKRQRIECS
ncbi:Nucleolar complex protein [Actinidia chinensis var. chinensis]|uniref:Nucleolar complex protein n=1 Tax=Actinidia chinensis var. chinensis TaxID=1590841 RepID=A0A2R6QHY9_ACTCC|nr:Nucleolar complex protein [Actinidia chinensis var. chinensis]